jgi:hypothetical protein
LFLLYLGSINSDLCVPVFGQSEGGHDKAVRVDDFGRDGPVVRGAFHDAGDLASVANPFQTSDEQAAAQKYGHSTSERKTV